MAAAVEIAGGWPGLAWDDDAVEVRPAGDTVAEVAETPGDGDERRLTRTGSVEGTEVGCPGFARDPEEGGI